MGVIIPAGFGQVNFRYGGPASPNGAEVTFGFATNPLTDAADTAAAFAANENANLRPLRVTGSVLTAVLVKFGPNATGPAVELGVSFAGTSAAEGVEPNTAVLVRKVTALGGRHGRGRVFFVGTNDATFDQSGLMPTVSLNLYRTGFDNFFDQAVTDGLPLYLLHGDAMAPTALTSLEPQALAATQRRRLRR